MATVLGELERDGHDRMGKSILVVPLRFATAGDRTFGDTKVPGLASTLNSLFSNGDSNSQGASSAKTMQNALVGHADKQKAAQATYGLQLPESGGNNVAAKRDEAQKANQLGSSDPLVATDAERPWFQSEESTNAIIVRGLPDRMKEYESLIHQLDIPQDLVEIEASIIDIRSDDFESLGVDWDCQPERHDPPEHLARLHVDVRRQLVGDAVGHQHHDADRQRRQAVAGARARPRRRRQGARAGAAQGAGRRQPHRHDDRQARRLGARGRQPRREPVHHRGRHHLEGHAADRHLRRPPRSAPVAVDPGRRLRSTVVDQVPIVKQTEIETEASVREGESLLIGGISVESTSTGTSGVPLLSKIPFLGRGVPPRRRREVAHGAPVPAHAQGDLRGRHAAGRERGQPRRPRARGGARHLPCCARGRPPRGRRCPLPPQAPVVTLATPRALPPDATTTALATPARTRPVDTACAVVALGLAADCGIAGTH